MATDGAEFKRRVKYHGLTYTEIKIGSGIDVIADVSVAGLGRELGGDNALHGLRDLVLCAADCLQGIFARDDQSLLQDLTHRLSEVASRNRESESQRIAIESLVREAGRLRSLGNPLDSSMIVDRLLSACGRDLHDGLVIAYADQYAMQHRQLTPKQLPVFLDAWQRQASSRLDGLMLSIFESGRPAKEFLRPRPELVSVKSDSFVDLTTINLAQ